MVYLIKAENTDLYKIGYTEGRIKDRVKGLQTGCPHMLSIIEQCSGSIAHEQHLHQVFEDNRTHGEWFEFNEETLKKVIDTMTSVIDTEKDIVEIRKFRDMYETFVREDSCDFRMGNFISLAILEIMLDNHDTAIQRLMEFKTIVFGGTHLKIIPRLNDRIYRTKLEL
tara:strand:+ start:753 stop:1256 length:504 start_codon:yes stop_codon:yes gene_type:complete